MSLVVGTGPQRSGLLFITKGVREFFALPFVQRKLAYEQLQIPAVTRCTWDSRERNDNADVEGGNRIAFMPGWGLSKRSYGAIEEPDQSAVSPRALKKWPLKCTASVWAVDNAHVEDDELQWDAAEGMVERLVQAAQYAALRDPSISTVVRFGEPYQDEFSVNRHYGVELLVPLTIDLYLRDIAIDQVTNPTIVVTKEPFGTHPPD